MRFIAKVIAFFLPLMVALFLPVSANAADHPLLDRLRQKISSTKNSSDHPYESLEANQLSKITVDGQDRTYLLRSPTTPKSNISKLPLVLVLHGGGGNATISEKMSGFTKKAMQEGFFVAYPNGSGKLSNTLLTWNAQHCCGEAMKESTNDIAFISSLIDELIRVHPIDPDRVYVTGMSNGAMMTEKIGIALAPKLAAIAPVAGALFGDEKQPAGKLSVIIFHGKKDESVNYEGGPPGGIGRKAWDGTPVKPAFFQSSYWSQANGCQVNSFEITKMVGYDIQSNHCSGYDVQLYSIDDGGHSWPGGKAGHQGADTPSDVLSATDVIWDFFKSHHRKR